MEWIEVSARTLPAAVELALDRLGVVEAELEYEVVDEPKSGLFGLGRTEARIRARVKPLSREKPVDRRRRNKRGSESRSSGGSRSRSATATAAAGAGIGGRPEGSDEGSRNGEPRKRSRRGGRGRGSGSGSNGAARQAESTGGRAPRAEAEDSEMDGAAALTIDEQADAAVRFTEELVRHFGVSATVGSEIVDDDIELEINGAGLGVLVGPNGATLHALEELVRAVVQHAAGGHSARLHLDVAGYRERRREALAAFATQVAEDVLASGAEKALEPMNPPDRKVVHDTVAELDGVATISVGEEPRRRVVIKPA
jgi:spoIIIJ-associated protein